MENLVAISLKITGIGMVVLFVALALLCGLMYGLTWITNVYASLGVGEGSVMQVGKRKDEGVRKSGELRRRAAIIAVALARAERHPDRFSPEPEGESSPWWMLHHQRHLALNACSRRRR